MSPKKKTQDGGSAIKISAPELWRFSFTRHDLTEDFDAESPLPLLFGLGLSRIAANKVGVELSVELESFPPLSLSVAYRAVFEFSEAKASDPQLEKQLRIISAQIAPAALYPFVREVIVGATGKSGLPPILPPIVNFHSVFDPDEVILPPVPPSEAAEPDEKSGRAHR